MFNSISKAIINSAIIITPLLAASQVQAADENVYDASSCVTIVLVRDHTNSSSVSCSLRQNLVGSTGTITLQSITASTGTAFSSTVYQELQFPKRSFTNTDEASAYLFCTLPPKQDGNLGSAISSYHIDED